MNSVFFLSLLLIVCAQNPNTDVVAPNSDDVIQSASQEVVIQHPVTVSVHAPQPMATRAPEAPLKTRVVVVHNNMVPVPIECFQPPDSGTCSKDMARVYYEHETRTCKPFSYTGCGGNANRFQSIKNCYRICHPYRYKIRPKVAKTSQHMKVRQMPAKRVDNYSAAAQAQAQAAQARSLLSQSQAGQSRSLYANPYPHNPYQQNPYQQPYGSYGYSGGARHVVMTPFGPQVKNQRVGQSSGGLPGNSAQLQNYASGAQQGTQAGQS